MWTAAETMEAASDWTAAREVQQRFMQRLGSGSETLEYSARCRQAQQVGGDFYHVVPLPNERTAFAIGDASGKGIAAALMISNVQSSLRTAMLFSGDDLADAIEVVNRQVFGSSLPDRYATLFYGVFDSTTRRLRYVNAGHHPPMLLRREGSVEWLETGGAPVGMFPDWNYEAGVVQLNPGDSVVAYTDGVTEAINPAADYWGLQGLQNAIAKCGSRCASEMVSHIFRQMDVFSHAHQTDDATIVVLRACTTTDPLLLSAR